MNKGLMQGLRSGFAVPPVFWEMEEAAFQWAVNYPFTHQIVSPEMLAPPLSYSVVSGQLPAGLQLGGTTGEISGAIGTAAYWAPFVIRLTDARGVSVDYPMSMQTFSDPYWANVVLLCGFNGTDGSTTIVDESLTPVTLTAVGNAQIDTSWAQYGTGSLLLDGSGDYVSAADSNDWTPAGSYTWEATIRMATTAIEQRLISHNEGVNGRRSWALSHHPAGGVVLLYSADGTAFATISSNSVIAAGEMARVAVTYNAVDQQARVFIDGVLHGQASVAGFYNAPVTLLIGAQTGSVDYRFNGNIDEIRLTKGVARYTDNYIPAPYPFPRG